MMNEDTLINEIIVLLKAELPEKYYTQLTEFERLVNEELMRASYDVLDELNRKGDWHPSAKLQSYIREYQVVF